MCKELLRISRAIMSGRRLSVGKGASIVDVIQRTLNHSPIERLEIHGDGNCRCPLEVFLGLKPSPRNARPTSMRTYKDVSGIRGKRCRRITDLGRSPEVLRQMHKEVCNDNNRRRSRAQQIHNTRTNVLPISIEIGDYVMIRSHAKRNHKL